MVGVRMGQEDAAQPQRIEAGAQQPLVRAAARVDQQQPLGRLPDHMGVLAVLVGHGGADAKQGHAEHSGVLDTSIRVGMGLDVDYSIIAALITYHVNSAATWNLSLTTWDF